AVGTMAFAFASDPGVVQNVIGEKETETENGPESFQSPQGSHTPANFTNSGTFNMNVNAFASGLGGPAATARAFALGVSQSLSGGTAVTGSASFSNSGNFSVGARATAVNATSIESAVASATGYVFVAGFANQVLNPIVVNSGSFNVNATALGATAAAFALGMGISGASVSGAIWNSGTMSVTASAPGGNATAIAIGIAANVFNGTITNTGTIRVLAIGSSTTAVGIGFTATTAFTTLNSVFAGPGDLGTITNDGGTLWAGVQNGTLDFGTVIDTTGAPNPILINLMGSTQQGDIWGNILLSPDDNILVTNGNTIFRGMINGTATFVGSMTISAGGTLTLATTGTGPSVVYVDNYTQTSSGTLAVNIFPSSGINDLGQINAITANLAGTLQVNVVAGLYANSQTYQDVVVASTLTGTWDTFVINTNTPFLSVVPVFPGDDTADLSLLRNAFTSVGGMTLNQMAAASGIENSYSTSLTGPYAAMIGEMFTFGSSTFISAVEQLHGADYAQNMMTNLGSMALLNYSIDDRLNAGPIASNNRQGTNIIQKGDVAIWARAQIVWGDADGDIEAPGYDQTQKAFYAGLDYAVNDDILIGFVAGYYDNELRFDNGNRKDDNGVQIGLYGEYDTQKYYIRGIGGYASYNADSVRHINFGSTVGTNFGTYDSTVTSFMIETGRRFEISQDFYFTPYGGLSYAKVKTDAFTETGLAASALAASSNSAKSFMSDLGARFTAAWDTGSNSKIIIEFGGAWQHEFKDDPLRFTTSFAGAPGSAFTVIGSVIDPDTFMLNAGISLATGGGFEIKASYWGRFNSNFQEHSAGLKVIRRF
ncbi:MAG: autotransporter domain-containing protein, partial [Proteobacteria bacterium]|nr:autotransporter domain-containing protein [Pseudomonadota bacterium]